MIKNRFIKNALINPFKNLKNKNVFLIIKNIAKLKFLLKIKPLIIILLYLFL